MRLVIEREIPRYARNDCADVGLVKRNPTVRHAR